MVGINKKVVFSKYIDLNSKIFILCESTWDIDVGLKRGIYKIIS